MCKKLSFWLFLFLIQLSASAQSKRPNVIFILADDMGYGDLGITGQEKFQPPNIDQLAKDGILFTQHYAGSTVCAPSRSAFLTGLHTGHTPIRGNKEMQPEGQYPLPDSMMTIPKLFKQAGYTTAAFGKWGLGFPESSGSPENQGIDEFFGYNCQRLAHRYYPEYLWKNGEKLFLEGNDWTEKSTYAPDLIHQEALNFIEKQDSGKPFFLYIPLIIPHAELAASSHARVEKYHQKFGPEKAHVAGKGGDYGPEMNLSGYQSNPYPRATFAAMMEEMDLRVGEIVQLLKERGLDENTLIIFTTDNGPHLEGGHDPEFFNSNGPFRGFKRDLYEGGIRVPLIMRWPSVISGGRVSEHASAFWDFLPTFSAILGIQLDQETDGVSMLPTIINQGKQNSHEYLYWEFIEQGGKQAIRKGNWKGVRTGLQKNPDAALELYDLETDPEENYNLAEKYPEIVKELMQDLSQARTINPVFQLFPGEK
jgi:arylsulfatase A